MNFIKHSDLEGQHAFLSASTYHWLNYDEEKLIESYSSRLARERGTILHEFAAQCIRLGEKLPRSKKTLNMYVNDAIGFKMTPEVVLYYSDNCFGTTDAISFRNNILRIHDFKTGVTVASMKQLLIYSALFCLEYRVNPFDIETKLRIYQSDDITYYDPEPEEIVSVSDKIISSDKILNKLRFEEG